MRAIVDMIIERKVYVDGMYCNEMFQRHTERFRKENIDEGIDSVNEFIFRRVNERNSFKVKEFIVKISDHNGHVFRKWNYKPSY